MIFTKKRNPQKKDGTPKYSYQCDFCCSWVRIGDVVYKRLNKKYCSVKCSNYG